LVVVCVFLWKSSVVSTAVSGVEVTAILGAVNVVAQRPHWGQRGRISDAGEALAIQWNCR
jgi:hypothetical protein